MADCPVVETLFGKVKGRPCPKAKPNESKQVFRYAGIPFAAPPVGNLRFEPPQACKPWEGVKDATKSGPAPMQDLSSMEMLNDYFPVVNQFEEDWENIDEDCLHLTVYTSNPNKTANMLVLVWLYGGALQGGGVDFYNGQVLCGLHDVVLVIPSYRVNIFGFLSTGKDTSHPGNMGMLDQVMALKWTRDNIRKFGGNPDNVTLFGQSAGAVSVGLHMISPMSKGLFHRAIQHSGACTMHDVAKVNYDNAIKELKDILNVTETEPDLIVKSLKSFPAKKLVEACGELQKKMVAFSVSVDGKFLPDLPLDLMKAGGLAPVPIIIGCNNSEGSGIMSLLNPPSFAEGYTEEEFTTNSKPSLIWLFSYLGEKLDKAIEVMKVEYGKVFSDQDKFKWSKMSSTVVADSYFVIPSIKQAMFHAKYKHSIYFYLMTHQLKCNHEDDYSMQLKQKVDFCECDHGDDIIFTLGLPLMNGKKQRECKFSAEEEELSKAWMTYIVNFAATGNPNKGKKVEYQWPAYDGQTKRHLSVQLPFTEGDHLKEDFYKLWKETIPNM